MRSLVREGRVVGIDVARAVALLGMMATHIIPGTARDGSIPLSHLVAGGRASALFAVLAGVSLGLMSGRTEPQQGRKRTATAAGLVVRALLITLIGLLLDLFDSGIAVILPYYGVLFLLAVPFLGLRARALFLLAAVWVVVGPVLSHLVRPHLPSALVGSSFSDPWELIAELTFTGYYPAVPWLVYALVGLGLARLGIGNRRNAAAIAAIGAGLALLSTAVSTWVVSRPGVWQTLAETFDGPGWRGSLEQTITGGLYGSTPTGSWWWLAVESPHTATPFDLVHTTGCAMVAIGLCVLAGHLAPRTLSIVFGAGAMTLTLYSAHVISRTDGWWDGEDASTYVAQVAVALAIGAVYALARRRGPLEAAVSEAQSAVKRATATVGRVRT